MLGIFYPHCNDGRETLMLLSQCWLSFPSSCTLSAPLLLPWDVSPKCFGSHDATHQCTEPFSTSDMPTTLMFGSSKMPRHSVVPNGVAFRFRPLNEELVFKITIPKFELLQVAFAPLLSSLRPYNKCSNSSNSAVSYKFAAGFHDNSIE